MCYMPRPSHSSRLAHLNNIWWAAQVMKLHMTHSLGSRNVYQMTEINALIQRAWKLWLSFRQIAHSSDAVPLCLVFAKSEQVCHKKPPVSTRVFKIALRCMINASNKESNCASAIPPHLQCDHSDNVRTYEECYESHFPFPSMLWQWWQLWSRLHYFVLNSYNKTN